MITLRKPSFSVQRRERPSCTVIGLTSAEVSYADFFEPPRNAKAPRSGKGKGKEKDRPNGKRRSKGVRFGDVDEQEAEEPSEEGEAFGTMSRVKGDLFDDDEEPEEEQSEHLSRVRIGADCPDLSSHEKRQRALAQQIAELEAEAIGPKDWTLLGEASAKTRPENSLLEEDLDFEQMGKVVPVVTEERVASLEELIKKRILDVSRPFWAPNGGTGLIAQNNFDSPVRVRAFEPTPFLPSRFFELQDTQSSKSLSQIYEEEYQAAATGSKIKDPRDEKLKKEHEEIEKLWGEIVYKLDALSSLNFVPKQVCTPLPPSSQPVRQL